MYSPESESESDSDDSDVIDMLLGGVSARKREIGLAGLGGGSVTSVHWLASLGSADVSRTSGSVSVRI